MNERESPFVNDQHQQAGDLGRCRAETLRRLTAYVGEEPLQQLIADEGLEILDHAVGYLLQRLRWRASDRARRERRLVPLEDFTELSPRPGLSFDPADRVADRLDLMAALAGLDGRDASLLWWAALGHSGADQRELWDERGFEPRAPTEAYLRKRISLARAELREMLLRR